MAGQQAPTHFWDPSSISYRDILTMVRLGPNYTYEDVVWHAWQSLLTLYFPPYTMNGQAYAIRREPYRGGLPPSMSLSEHRPDIIVIRMLPAAANPQALPDPTVPDPARDVLWVECKAPSVDTPSGWKDLMEEAGERLRAAHPDRMLYVILAIGLKWMFFKWDPLNPHAAGQGTMLEIVAQSQHEVWTMERGYHYEPAVTGQSHVHK